MDAESSTGWKPIPLINGEFNMQVRLFAGAREAVQSDTVELELELPCTIGMMKRSMISKWPGLESYVNYGRFAVGNDFVDDHFVVESNAGELALIPPVSGG